MPIVFVKYTNYDFDHIKSIFKSQLSQQVPPFSPSEGVGFTLILILGILVLIYCILRLTTRPRPRRTTFNLEADPSPKAGQAWAVKSPPRFKSMICPKAP
jgi:hypothetical protein